MTHSYSQAPLPHPWRRCRHPNGDIYFYNPQLRLITPDNICDPEILEYLTDARDDHLQCLDGDPNLHLLHEDYELVISDVSDTEAVIRMYSRTAGAAYTWTEERGSFPFHFSHFSLALSNSRLTGAYLELCRVDDKI